MLLSVLFGYVVIGFGTFSNYLAIIYGASNFQARKIILNCT